VRQARKQGVTGWVRNLSNGQVEAVFEGDRNAVEQAVAWCRKGPISARVVEAEADWEEEGEARYTAFDVRQ
jgi:acylphosphatase